MKLPLILYTKNSTELPPWHWKMLLEKVPAELASSITRYRRWQDRQASLFGKLLLANGLVEYGYSKDLLKQLFVDYYQRPELPIDLDFNISHAQKYVLCAFSKRGSIGIDIEKIRPVRFDDFRSVLAEEEQLVLTRTPDREKLFCRIWTKKEAAIKADGKGFSNELQEVSALDSTIVLNNRNWYLHEIKIDDDYCCYIATEQEVMEYEIREVFFL